MQSKRKKNCGNCREAGHSIRTCPKIGKVHKQPINKEVDKEVA